MILRKRGWGGVRKTRGCRWQGRREIKEFSESGAVEKKTFTWLVSGSVGESPIGREMGKDTGAG